MSFIGLGVAIGNIAGAVAGSVGAGLSALGATGLGTAIGGTTAAGSIAGAGGIGSLLGATAAGTAGSALAGTAGTGLGEAATALGIGGVESSAAPTAASVAGGGAPQSVAGLFPSGTPSAASTVESAGLTSGGAPVSGAVPTAPGASLAPAAAEAAPTTLTSGGMTGFGHTGDTFASNVVTKGVEGINQEIANAKTKQGETDYLNTLAAEDAAGRQAAKQLYSGSGQGLGGRGWAEGGIATIQAAKGGSVRLQNGAYVVPADVVSALGNGSSKAGAKYLTHLCRALEAGPPPKAGSLAKRRAKERHTA